MSSFPGWGTKISTLYYAKRRHPLAPPTNAWGFLRTPARFWHRARLRATDCASLPSVWDFDRHLRAPRPREQAMSLHKPSASQARLSTQPALVCPPQRSPHFVSVIPGTAYWRLLNRLCCFWMNCWAWLLPSKIQGSLRMHSLPCDDFLHLWPVGRDSHRIWLSSERWVAGARAPDSRGHVEGSIFQADVNPLLSSGVRARPPVSARAWPQTPLGAFCQLVRPRQLLWVASRDPTPQARS